MSVVLYCEERTERFCCLKLQQIRTDSFNQLPFFPHSSWFLFPCDQNFIWFQHSPWGGLMLSASPRGTVVINFSNEGNLLFNCMKNKSIGINLKWGPYLCPGTWPRPGEVTWWWSWGWKESVRLWCTWGAATAPPQGYGGPDWAVYWGSKGEQGGWCAKIACL